MERREERGERRWNPKKGERIFALPSHRLVQIQ
jgi:hypothetical protein